MSGEIYNPIIKSSEGSPTNLSVVPPGVENITPTEQAPVESTQSSS